MEALTRVDKGPLSCTEGSPLLKLVETQKKRSHRSSMLWGPYFNHFATRALKPVPAKRERMGRVRSFITLRKEPKPAA